MPSPYIDFTAITQIIGCVFNKNDLLDNQDEYHIYEEDFPDEFHRVIYGAMYNLYQTGSSITLDGIVDYLSVRPKFYTIFKNGKGTEYLTKASNSASADTFNYYYHRLKKFTLLRMYDNFGINVNDMYDPTNILDIKKKQKQEEWLDNTTLQGISDLIDKRVEEIKNKFVDSEASQEKQAGDGMLELIENLQINPEVGIPMYGPLINTVTRGARLRKFYLRSAPTGVGKTRTMIADACNFACNRIYMPEFKSWVKNGTSEPTLYIATEQDLGEIQTMMLAFLADVDEEHILNGKYLEGEKERVIEAAHVIKESPIWVETLPDFSLKDIENKIKKNIRKHDVKYVVHDYIHTSMKILEEITHQSGGVRLREDNILFMLSNRMKDLCNKYGIFILSATQLNGDYKDSDTPDQNLLRGAKSIADKIDVGMILLPVTDEDLKKLAPILEANPNFGEPNIKLSVYKNRRGSYKGVYLWCNADLSTCRVEAKFCTDYRHKVIGIDNIKVIVDEPSAF